MGLIRFSTDGAQTKSRIAAIRDGYGSIAKLDIEPLSDGEFDFSGRTVGLPSLTISTMATSPCEVIRRGEHTSYKSELVILGIGLGGSFRARQKGSESVDFVAGEAYLRANDRPGGLTMTGEAPAILNIAIPHQRLAPTLRDPPGQMRKPPSSSSLTLLINYVRMLLREGGDLPPEAAVLASEHVRDLMALVLGATPDAAESARKGGLRAARLQAVKADIAANLGSARLSLEWLAARHGISPRYLRALFYGEGTSLTDYVLEARLAHAHRLLTRDHVDERNINAIALASGFGDLSWFHQTFRRRFEMTPADAREAARKDPIRPENSVPNPGPSPQATPTRGW